MIPIDIHSTAIQILRKWKHLGKQELQVAKWSNCNRLRCAAEEYTKAMLSNLSKMVKESDRILSPLCDPLKINFGLHRWLASDREEAYSDWLAWIFSELGSPKRIANILYGDLDSAPQRFLALKGNCKADREVWVQTGHIGHTGRLDLVLIFGDDGLIVVELKVIGAESADTLKQSGYIKWLDDKKVSFKDAFLIATSGEYQKDYEGFKLLLWETLCKHFRKMLPELIREDSLLTASFIAGFVSAVEQNLIGLPALTWTDESERPANALWMIDGLEATIRYLGNILDLEGHGDE